MDDSMDRLTDRLRPRHLLNDFLDYWQARGVGEEDARRVTAAIRDNTQAVRAAVVRQVRNHPAPVLLMGAGIAWWVLDPAHNLRRRHFEQSAAESAEDSTHLDHRMPDRVSEGFHQAQARLGEHLQAGLRAIGEETRRAAKQSVKEESLVAGPPTNTQPQPADDPGSPEQPAG